VKIDFENFQLEDLLAAAIKSEISSNRIYRAIATQVKNVFLRERLLFLSREEEKHRQALKKLFNELFPAKKVKVPRKDIVPLPEIKIDKEEMLLSDLFQQSMKVEKETAAFYRLLALKFLKKNEQKNLLNYLASMEMGHYRILEIEKQNLEEFEDYQQEIPLIHVGP